MVCIICGQVQLVYVDLHPRVYRNRHEDVLRRYELYMMDVGTDCAIGIVTGTTDYNTGARTYCIIDHHEGCEE
jgi:hypothetical protein